MVYVREGFIVLTMLSTAVTGQDDHHIYHHCYQEGGFCGLKDMTCYNDTVIDVVWSVIGYSDYWQHGDRSNCSITNDTCYAEIDEPVYNCSGLTTCSLFTCSESTWQAITCSTTVATNFMRINYTCRKEIVTTQLQSESTQEEFFTYSFGDLTTDGELLTTGDIPELTKHDDVSESTESTTQSTSSEDGSILVIVLMSLTGTAVVVVVIVTIVLTKRTNSYAVNRKPDKRERDKEATARDKVILE